jgi:putative DNA primase/helicase
MQEYEEENNPMLAFLKEMDIDTDIINEPAGDVYRRYTVFCQENGLSAIGNSVFSRQLCSMLNIKSVPRKVNGKSKKVYMR